MLLKYCFQDFLDDRSFKKIGYLNSKSVSLIGLNKGGDKIDTGTAIGKLMITILSSIIAEFEAYTIKDRQLEGIEEANKRGVYKGRPKKSTEMNKSLQYAHEIFKNLDTNRMTVNEICDITKISGSTLYRSVGKREGQL